MNKILYYTRNTTFIIVFGGLIYALRFINNAPLAYLVYPIFISLGALTYLQNRRDIKIIESDNTYNLLFSLVNLFVLLLLIRNFFDPYIMYNQFLKAEKTMIFLANNFLFMIILYGSLLTYNILAIRKK